MEACFSLSRLAAINTSNMSESLSSEENLFGTNEKFKNSIALLNELSSEKFPLLLQRIMQKLDMKNVPPFSSQEQTQLQNVFHLNLTQLQMILDASSFILEQAAYYGISSEILSIQLEKSGLTTEKISAFVKVWTAGARDLISKLRRKCIAPFQLESISWRLHLQMNHNGNSGLKDPYALFDLNLSSSAESGSSSTSFEKENDDHLLLEFNTLELYDFFNKLETIQEQLDNLG